MAKDSVIQQYNQIRDLIMSNVGTIEKLLETADTLSKIVETISEEEKNAALKADLKAQLDKVTESISDLVKQTRELFRHYNRFAEEAFR